MRRCTAECFLDPGPNSCDNVAGLASEIILATSVEAEHGTEALLHSFLGRSLDSLVARLLHPFHPLTKVVTEDRAWPRVLTGAAVVPISRRGAVDSDECTRVGIVLLGELHHFLLKGLDRDRLDGYFRETFLDESAFEGE